MKVSTLLALGSLLAAAGAAQASAPNACRFTPPQDFPAARLSWSGGCADGLAQGSGILRAYERGRVVRTFFGTLRDGQAVLGVIEVPDEGFIAGRFAAGARVDDGERNTLIQAFDIASQAARALAARYRSSGKPASARYYEAKAVELARQLD